MNKKIIIAWIGILAGCAPSLDNAINGEECSINDENYSHTVLQCGLKVVGAELFCDPNGEHDRDMCLPYYDMSDGNDCETHNKCWDV